MYFCPAESRGIIYLKMGIDRQKYGKNNEIKIQWHG